ncbi:MAG: rubrerythrin [Bdellovibrionales bacterium GWB1_55_8]|nr:MAG: rubrerythrin [Bdellovibrionales bacterium GWB1_55_8]
MPTQENLKIAFAGESQANRKYLAFAKKADLEGFSQIATLFRAAAEAETIHALAHFQNMGGVQSTLENLKSAVAGETHEAEEMYPPMVDEAKAEGHRAKTMLEYALGAEKVHARLYETALEAVKQGKDLSKMEIYICPVCGDLEFGMPTEDCHICGAKPSKYRLVH